MSFVFSNPMRLLYTIWCALLFAILFTLFFPFIFLCIQWDSTRRYAQEAVRLMGQCFFFLIGMPIRVDWRFRPDAKQAYVYCANHFSYFDIAVTGVVVPGFYAFIGKKGVKKIPLFGYMFARLHIMVDREAARSRAYSLAKSIRVLKEGRSIIIFPEGGILTKEPPKMAYPFKDGAFIMAIQQQVPIVPMTLVNNHYILPDESPIRMRWSPVKVVFHEPIPTTGLTPNDLDQLKEQTFRIIDNELHSQWAKTIPYESR
ncbi:1-acyl-sn-glycerol-3-phosphate acyltransferase [Rudanella paleaurantiibacter]|uniref:1-acyl-sn-glycerol-3-phosphate acyltransferase n=2 Tax=Rudanella paleaurantiibacter TaxID=2614655 RepID=A0A7J5TZ83_9BACT|nr:1-acyl-sn-glycerol-3-phosphate acyltransferase [Rudanella paleaurantiibacter]